METVLYAYQMSPGSDDLLWFAETAEECHLAAIAQRAEMLADNGGTQLGAMAVYRFVFRDLKPIELVWVLNEERSIVDIAAVDRRLVAVIAE